MHFSWNLIGKFLKFNWKLLNYIRILINNIFSILLILFIFSIYFIYKNENDSNQSYHGALLINLDGTIVEQTFIPNNINKISKKFLNLYTKQTYEITSYEIVNSIRNAAIDQKINGIVLQLDKLVGSDQSSMKYIGKALNEFKKSGKPIFAIGNSYNQIQYYIASFANKIYISNQGHIGIYGFKTYKLYFKKFLENIKINTHIFRIGTYKSAVEPFIRNNMSHEAHEAEKHWIYLLWMEYLKDIAKNRNINIKDVFPGASEFIEKLKIVRGNSAQYAIKQKLVDFILTENNIKKELKKKFGWNYKNNNFNCISIYDYKNKTINTNNNKQQNSTPQKANIAVIIINGILSNTMENQNTVNSEEIVNEIYDAMYNDNIKSIILRINSPGGSVDASEKIRNALCELRNTKKPIIVSMGGIAASGGYWIATPANYIIANSNTLTGSIGIFGIINTFEKTLESIGIYTDGISTTPLAEHSLTKGISKEYSEMLKLNINNGYHTFLKYVATSRNKNIETINKIAQGRIWTGSDALKNGLIDQIGDFDDAIKKASELGKIRNPKLEWMQPKYSFIDQILFNIILKSQNILFNEINFSYYSKYLINKKLNNNINLLNNIYDPINYYAYCLNCFIIY